MNRTGDNWRLPSVYVTCHVTLRRHTRVCNVRYSRGCEYMCTLLIAAIISWLHRTNKYRLDVKLPRQETRENPQYETFTYICIFSFHRSFLSFFFPLFLSSFFLFVTMHTQMSHYIPSVSVARCFSVTSRGIFFVDRLQLRGELFWAKKRVQYLCKRI